MSSLFKRPLRFLAVLVVLSASPVSGSAQLLYTNGVPDNLNGWPVFSPFYTANDFTLLSRSTLQTLDWYVLRGGTGGPATITSNFGWTLTTDVDGMINPVGFESGGIFGATGTKTPFGCCGGNFIYEAYLFSGITLNNVTLDAGRYWLSLGTYDELGGDDPYGYWATSMQVGNQETFNGSSWSMTGGEGAFSIYGTAETGVVPEPASITLFGAGLIGLYGFARRRRGASGNSALPPPFAK